MNNRTRLLLAGLTVVLFSALAYCAYVWIQRGSNSSHAPKSLATGAHPAQQPETVKVTLSQDGFAPGSATRAAGTFRLAIDNRSGVAELHLRLKRDGSGEQVLEYSVPDGATDFSQAIDLQAGGYALREVNHPAWIFHITAQ